MNVDKEEKAIKMLKEQKETIEHGINAMECIPEDYDEDVYHDFLEWNENAQIILNLIEKQDKIIDLMAEEIEDLHTSLINEYGSWQTDYVIENDVNTSKKAVLEWARKEVEK